MFDGTRYLVSARNGRGEIIGMFVGRAGNAGAPFVMTENADSEPSVAWDGERYLVAYQAGRAAAQFVSPSGTPIGQPVTFGTTMAAPRVTADRFGFVVAFDGKILRVGSDDDPIVLAESDSDVALAPSIVAYTAHAEELHRVPRVFTRVFGAGRRRAARN